MTKRDNQTDKKKGGGAKERKGKAYARERARTQPQIPLLHNASQSRWENRCNNLPRDVDDMHSHSQLARTLGVSQTQTSEDAGTVSGEEFDQLSPNTPTAASSCSLTSSGHMSASTNCDFQSVLPM